MFSPIGDLHIGGTCTPGGTQLGQVKHGCPSAVTPPTRPCKPGVLLAGPACMYHRADPGPSAEIFRWTPGHRRFTVGQRDHFCPMRLHPTAPDHQLDPYAVAGVAGLYRVASP
ncbi:hypothetical protein PGT21_002648 [Puccinia graminis f. sp. tritici]|uniref:Uncharacterized protein n=1 Tax=Puccinia graminis f. sp. tritici TaxID=56615 RepID=A0A5B0PT53_PUCGR|nr:hypothetical protein PGTUg99_013768 [Puccinia graminis f. sp. tritici]KAA1103852.1 hypothetical protein PGT21_002648 [Puccinia graminis f. sp. tritici]